MGTAGGYEVPWKRVWITGASQGIGRALALALAEFGVHVAVSARNQEKLEQLADQSRHLTGSIQAFPLDVTDRHAVAKTVNHIESSWGEIDLAVLNAGTFIAMDAAEFDCDTVAQQLDLNVMGVCYCIEPLISHFLPRKRGHIAINGSLAGYRGLPRSGGYGASKAALINLAESLKLDLNSYNIKVQIINPGFVKTPLTDKNDFDMPFLMESDKAAQAMIRGFKSSRFEIRFPRLFGFILGTLKRLPYGLYFSLIQKWMYKS